jgi:hypothetical protein
MAWGEALLLAGPSTILTMRARENVLKDLRANWHCGPITYVRVEVGDAGTRREAESPSHMV